MALVKLTTIILCLHLLLNANAAIHNYSDALTKSILFFEGQRSGKLPPDQRMTWRGDSGLHDGFDKGVDLTGGYYDAGDNVKFNFPMAFTATMLAWGVQEYGRFMGRDKRHARDAIRWATDYFLKCTAKPGVVFAQVGEPNGDHACWERPEDMDTPRTSYAVTTTAPGSEVAAEMAAAMAAASMVFRNVDRNYSRRLLRRAVQTFEFADKYRGSYNDGIGKVACPFYCNNNGYEDELVWAAAWLFQATRSKMYWNYVVQNMENNFKSKILALLYEFSWDSKAAGINVMLARHVLKNGLENTTQFLSYADNFVCNIMPESPNRFQHLSPAGLISNAGMCNMQTVTAKTFLLLSYAHTIYVHNRSKHQIRCNGVLISPSRLIKFAIFQVNYILGDNPLKMSYMVGYGNKYPKKVHHRGSTLPSINMHAQHMKCHDGTSYFVSPKPNRNVLAGAVVGGPDQNDQFVDNRYDAGKTEPTTYINAPLVGVLAFLKALYRQ